MNKSVIRCLAVGWIGTTGWVSLSQAVLADEPEPTPQIAVYVYNWAEVEPNTLREAKEVATQIFRKAGVEATLLDGPLPSKGEQGKVVTPSNFFVQIVSVSMAESYGLPTQVLGIAPGNPQELNRVQVYVFDHVAARMAQAQTMARVKKIVSFNADKGQILGHGMAHEIGHVLLRQASHSPKGLMRANWDRNDMQNVATGKLLFTAGEAERVRAEVSRRNSVQIALNPGK